MTWGPTSKQRLIDHLISVHGYETEEVKERTKAELQRAHGWIRADRKCGWKA